MMVENADKHAEPTTPAEPVTAHAIVQSIIADQQALYKRWLEKYVESLPPILITGAKPKAE